MPSSETTAADTEGDSTRWRRPTRRTWAEIACLLVLALAAVYFTPAAYTTGVRILIGVIVAFSAATAALAYRKLAPRVGTLTAWVAITVAWAAGTTTIALATGSCTPDDSPCTAAAAASWMVVGASWVAVQFTIAATVYLARRFTRLTWHLGTRITGRNRRTDRADRQARNEAARSGNPARRAASRTDARTDEGTAR